VITTSKEEAYQRTKTMHMGKDQMKSVEERESEREIKDK
jgi:hypothetical protein